MIVQKIGIQYSPNDLLRFLDSPFVSWMDRASEVNPVLKQKYERFETELTKKLFDEGLTKEKYILRPFRKEPNSIDIQGSKKFDLKYFEFNLKKTREAMMQGKKYIIQAYLKKNNFFGVADLLERVDGVPSLLGNYYYVIKDAKMAQSPKSSFIIQVCAYCDILESMQGVRPKTASVLLGNGKEVEFNVDDYYQFYLNLKQNFISFHNQFKIDKSPNPSLKDNLWYWETAAKEILKEKDDISLIADIEKEDVKILKQKGIQTTKEILELDNVEGDFSPESWLRIKKQASIQSNAQVSYELLPHSIHDPKGLLTLPSNLDSDVYCEIKTAPTIEGGEFIYLYNFYYNKEGSWTQESIECGNSEWEKGYLARFLRTLHSLVKDQGTVYFFGDNTYQKILEKSAQHSTYLFFVEKLFFSNRIIDFKTIIKQAMVVNVASYTFSEVSKSLGYDTSFEEEEFALYSIKTTGSKANKEWAAQELTKLLLIKMQALRFLHLKLLEIKNIEKLEYVNIGISDVATEDEDPLILGENFNQEKYNNATENEKIALLIKQLSKFYSHESKPKKVETAILLKRDLSFWRKSPRCLTSLKKENIVNEEKRQILYKFPFNEETKIKEGDSVIIYKNPKMRATVIYFNESKFEITLAFSKSAYEAYSGEETISIMEDNHLPTKLIDKHNVVFKELFNEEAPFCGLPKCVYDFLYKKHPDVNEHIAGEPLYLETDDFLSKVTEKISNLNKSTIIIQGPPGAGKTYTSANVILDLVSKGKRIAVSSNSHKAVDNVLLKLKELAPSVKIAKIEKDFNEELIESEIISSNKEDLEELRDVSVIGGTIFGLMKGLGRFDYIFVDEAGQVGLAAILGYGLITDNLVLIGDQMQLEQPIQAVHPGESGKSSLEYYLGGFKTIPSDRGFFLSESRRMNLELCDVVSKLFYEGKLKSHPSAHQRELRFLTPGIITKNKGIEFINVPHKDNTQHSSEEVEKIKDIVDFLLGQRLLLDGVEKNITLNDLIFVSPYNMQVSKLRKAFPDARVGSVDLFQGQEAPIVIYSMAASAPGARGIGFLLNENRINVALSRGQALAIIVGSDNLANISTNKLSELKLLNMFLKLKSNKF